METDSKLDYDSDIIICEETPEIILVPSSPDIVKKVKTKKQKRKVKRGINYSSNTETLLITQQFEVNKTKLKCLININTLHTLCQESSDSIVRHEKNICKKEAYYHRILPICMRKKCSDDNNYILSSSWRSTKCKKHKKEVNAGSPSPVSSVALTEVLPCNNISYEEVSNGDFSWTSDEELETLIKRTKQRENKINHSYSAPQHFNTSTPISTFQDISSPYSIDMEKSIHSDTTMMLNPLSSEAYSPTVSIDYIEMDNLERSTTKANYAKNNLIYIDVPYSPTTPDLIKAENLDNTSICSVKNTHNEDDIPSSPYIPESIEMENIDYESIINRRNSHNDMSALYSPTNLNSMSSFNDTPYSPTIARDFITMEDFNNPTTNTHARVGLNVAYSPSSPTMSPNLIRENKVVSFTINKIKDGDDANVNVTYSPAITSDLIEVEKIDYETNSIKNIMQNSAIINPDLIKRENTES